VAIITREPTPAAFELDRDNVQVTIPVGAARLLIDVYAMNFLSMYFADHFKLTAVNADIGFAACRSLRWK
jgi:hypothetical protein